uniref:Uncharacterized protein n=1 Tax=Cucumis melo TaxID=3656 RepID=A0A9I9DI34_CUCME
MVGQIRGKHRKQGMSFYADWTEEALQRLAYSDHEPIGERLPDGTTRWQWH